MKLLLNLRLGQSLQIPNRLGQDVQKRKVLSLHGKAFPDSAWGIRRSTSDPSSNNIKKSDVWKSCETQSTLHKSEALQPKKTSSTFIASYQDWGIHRPSYHCINSSCMIHIITFIHIIQHSTNLSNKEESSPKLSWHYSTAHFRWHLSIIHLLALHNSK